MKTPIFNIHDLILVLTLAVCLLLVVFQWLLSKQKAIGSYLLSGFFVCVGLTALCNLLLWNDYIVLHTPAAKALLALGLAAAVVGSVGSHGNTVTAGSGTVVIGTSGGGAAFTAPQPLTFGRVFDEQFRVLSDEGQPLANVPYFIRDAAGNTYQGFTDTAGRTPRIATPNQQSLFVSVGVHALEQWGQV